MKRLAVALFLLVLSQFAHAATSLPNQKTVTLSFDKVPVTQLLNVVYGDILKQNFVVHPALVDSELKASLHFQTSLDNEKISQFMVTFLNRLDIVVEQKNGYIFITPLSTKEKEKADDEVFFYRPKYRPVSFIVDLTASVFKNGRFTSQRAVNSSVSADGGKSSFADHPPTTSKQSKPVDTGTNALSVQSKQEADAFVFVGTQKDVASLKKLLEQIDTPIGEVVVKGTVYEVTTGGNEGSAFSLVASVLSGKLGVNIGRTVAGDSLTIRSQNLEAVVSALSSDNRFKSVSNASIRVKSGATGVLSVGSDVPVLGAVQVASNGSALQSVEYRPSGVILNLSPVVRDASVDVTINQQLSSFIQTTTGVNNSPTLIKRQLSTTVAASDDDVIVLGGLDEDKAGSSDSGLPFLPAVLKTRTSDSSKTQIILVLNVRKI